MAVRNPATGRFYSKAELAELEAQGIDPTTYNHNENTTTEENDMSATDTVDTTESMDDLGIEFVDELPKINRKVESGVWVKRLAPLRDNPDRWAKVFGPTPSPHAQINNLRGGSAAGINPDEFDFAGRMIETGETDDEGKPVKQGYVFARFVSDEDERADLKARREERGRKAREAREASE